MKMSDAEIIKACECCGKAYTLRDCEILECPAFSENGCGYAIKANSNDEEKIHMEQYKDISGIINRQQAENDRLKSLVLELLVCVARWSSKHDNDLSDELNKIPVMDEYRNKFKEVKSEAYKEFAERLKRKAKKPYGNFYEPTVFVEDIDNLLKEMGCGE